MWRLDRRKASKKEVSQCRCEAGWLNKCFWKTWGSQIHMLYFVVKWFVQPLWSECYWTLDTANEIILFQTVLEKDEKKKVMSPVCPHLKQWTAKQWTLNLNPLLFSLSPSFPLHVLCCTLSRTISKWGRIDRLKGTRQASVCRLES